MSRYSINSAGFSGGVHLVEDPHPLDDTTVVFGLEQRGPARQSQTPTDFDGYGLAVSISGDILATSLPGDETVEVYHKIEGVWTYHSTLTSGVAGDEFGTCVSVSSNKIVVGAPNSDDGAGAVYAFEFKANEWRESSPFKLQAINLEQEPYARYGSAVELTGNTLVVGAPLAAGGSTTEDTYGAVYGWTYRNYSRTWVAHNVTLNPTPQHDSGFGSSLSVENENFLCVGAPKQSVNQSSTITGAGKVFIFARQVTDQGDTTNWVSVSSVEHLSATEDMFFGKSINYSGDRLIVGAPGAPGGGTATYFYGRPDSLTPIQELNVRAAETVITDSTVTEGDLQGTVVFGDPSRKAFMVGAPGNNGVGAIYLFEQTESGNWHPASISKLTASDGQSGDNFGSVFFYDGGTMVIGTPNRDSSKGGFYIFA